MKNEKIKSVRGHKAGDRFQKRHSAFTLIELLVVISIIALLLSIMMPALSKARELSRRVACQSNLKQQSLACRLYMADNREYYPSYHKRSDDRNNAVASYWLWGGRSGSGKEVLTQERFLNPYISVSGKVTNTENDGALRVFYCPADRGASGGAWPVPRLPTVWENVGASYHYNTVALANTVDGLWNKRLFQIRVPHQVIVVGCNPVATYFLNNNPFQEMYWHHKTELGWTNVAFADTHVGFIRMIQGKQDEYDYQNGPEWTVLYNGPKYKKSQGWY